MYESLFVDRRDLRVKYYLLIIESGLHQMTATAVLTFYLDINFGAHTRRHHLA